MMQEESVFQTATEESTHVVSLSEFMQGMDKFQDHTYIGDSKDEETGEAFKYAMVTDGHGADICTNILLSTSLDKIAEMVGKNDPVGTVAEYINSRIPKFCQLGTGATMCLVKVYKDRIVCINSGDSQAYVYCDGDLVFKTKEHTAFNEEEVARLKAMNPDIDFTSSNSFNVVSENRLVQCSSKYVHWPDGQRLAPTQALGHGGRTGYAPDKTTIPIEAGRSYQVIVGSDGIWDMMVKDSVEDAERLWGLDAAEVVRFARDRWLQEWEMVTFANPDRVIRNSFKPSECDDMCASVVQITAK
jgi:serine/threonine protein phosphatase PrpC